MERSLWQEKEQTEPLLISSAFNLLAISKKTVLFSIDGLWTKWFYGFSANLTLDIFSPLNGGILHILVVILKTKTVAQILFYVLDLGFIWVLAVVMVLVLKTSCEWSVDPHPFTYQSISIRERKWVAQPAWPCCLCGSSADSLIRILLKDLATQLPLSSRQWGVAGLPCQMCWLLLAAPQGVSFHWFFYVLFLKEMEMSVFCALCVASGWLLAAGWESQTPQIFVWGGGYPESPQN